MRQRSTLIIALLAILFSCAGAPIAFAQEDSIAIDPSLVNDGPFVSFLDDTTLSVDYICHGEHHHQTVPINDSALIPDCDFDIMPGDLFVYDQPLINSPTRLTGINQIMVISDLHGEYDHVVNFLKQNQIIDDSLSWIWGEGHLVVNGDIFDRGAKVYETLWLIYRLQHEAVRAGGAVHFLLGNHELMVLRGDERYLNPKYPQVVLSKLGLPHTALIAPNTILGDWLRSLPTMIVIDSLLFVHGGISLELLRSGLAIDQINAAAPRFLELSKDSVKADSLASLLYRSNGPFWFRRMVWDYNDLPQLTRTELDSVLIAFEARAIVVGHSEHDSLTALFDNHLFAIDVPVDDLGGFEGLLVENQAIYRVKPTGDRIFLGHLDRTPPGSIDLR